MTIGIPYSLVPGSKAKAEEVNANFIALKNGIENLDSSKANKDFSNLTASEIETVKETIGVTYKNVGEIVYSTIPLIDNGLHLLDGALIRTGAYTDFVNYIKHIYETDMAPNIFCSEEAWQTSVNTYGECGKFVYDSENETVRLPKIDGLIQGTSDLSVLGNLVQAGLPAITHTHTRGSMDITGKFYVRGYKSASETSTNGTIYEPYGAFTRSNNSTTGAYAVGDSGTKYQYTMNFKASNSWSGSTSNNSSVNFIYGKSTTVQPQTVKCFIYIVIANNTKTEIQSNIDDIFTDLSGKADSDGTNMTPSVKKFDSEWVGETYDVASSVSLNNSTNNYNLSSYLPDDDYCYEVIGSVYGNTGSTSGDYVDIRVSSSVIDSAYRVASARTRSSSTVSWSGTFVMIVGPDRTISLGNSSSYNASVSSFKIFAYRRVGTNK